MIHFSIYSQENSAVFEWLNQFNIYAISYADARIIIFSTDNRDMALMYIFKGQIKHSDEYFKTKKGRYDSYMDQN